MVEPSKAMNDLRPMLEQVELLLQGKMKQAERHPFVLLHALFNGMLRPDLKMATAEVFRKRYARELEIPSIAALIAHAAVGEAPDWTLEKHAALHADYYRQRRRPNGLHAPLLLEAIATLQLTERHRLGGSSSLALALVRTAAENWPNRAELRGLEKNFDADLAIDWKAALLPAATTGTETSDQSN